MLRLGREAGLDCAERNISLTEIYTADEVFTTGTMGELTPVLEIDGRVTASAPGPITRQLQALYAAHVAASGTALPL